MALALSLSSGLCGRFLRDYDALFPVAEDVSLLQQASSVLYPSTTATRTGLSLARSELGCWHPEEQGEVYPGSAGLP